MPIKTNKNPPLGNFGYSVPISLYNENKENFLTDTENWLKEKALLHNENVENLEMYYKITKDEITFWFEFDVEKVVKQIYNA